IRVLQVPHVGLVNLIAEREVAPEFLQDAATPGALADAVLPLLDPASAAARRQREGLALVRERLGPPGAAERVAALAAELAGVPRSARVVQAGRRRRAAGPGAPPATGRRGGAHPRRPARPGGADEAGRAGRGPTRRRARDRGGRAHLLRLVAPVLGPVLPAAA